jgi:hypothetical protein
VLARGPLPIGAVQRAQVGVGEQQVREGPAVFRQSGEVAENRHGELVPADDLGVPTDHQRRRHHERIEQVA